MSNKFQKSSSPSSSQVGFLSRLTCSICPHFCSLSPNETGKCNIIGNFDGRIQNSYEGKISQLAIEPIEKRPFYHVKPGSKFLSVGFYGCNLVCDYCANFKVSQRIDGDYKKISPVELVGMALKKKVSGIAFTYNEPTLYYNYIEEVGHEIGRRNYDLKLVVKTNGFVNFSILRNLCLYVDAFNIDLKGNDEDYDDVCGGSLDPVLDAASFVSKDMGNHLEISYLVLPSRLNDRRFNLFIRDWIEGLSKYIPLHLLYFYPFHRMHIKSYKPRELISLAEFFKERLPNVYLPNHYHPDMLAYKNTQCIDCHKTVIERKLPEVITSFCEHNISPFLV